MLKINKYRMAETGTTGGVVITPGDLISASTKVMTASDDLKKAIATIKEKINNIEGSWSDASAKKYLEEFRALEPTLTEFEQAAEGYGKFLKNVHDIYQKYAEENATSVNTAN